MPGSGRRLSRRRASLFVQSSAPLFVHQYSHAWLDLRHLRDGPINYFQNSRLATILHREFCLGLRDRFPWFGEDMWGITSSDSRYGYIDWGGSTRPPTPKSTERSCLARLAARWCFCRTNV